MIEDIKKTLWATADKLRANMDAAEYQASTPRRIFVTHVSATFADLRVSKVCDFLKVVH